jgi:hypothetical protein
MKEERSHNHENASNRAMHVELHDVLEGQLDSKSLAKPIRVKWVCIDGHSGSSRRSFDVLICEGAYLGGLAIRLAAHACGNQRRC